MIEVISEKHVYEYINDMIMDAKIEYISFNNEKYHHNTRYENALSICKYGILTLQDINKLNIRKDTNKFLNCMDDIDSHANGFDCVSLSVTGLTDLYRDEEEYDPFSPSVVDFIVSDEIKTSRYSVNYGNEFLHHGSISRDKMLFLNTRITELLKQNNVSNISLIEKYNILREIAIYLKEEKLNINMRESSLGIGLDIDKLSSKPKVLVK